MLVTRLLIYNSYNIHLFIIRYAVAVPQTAASFELEAIEDYTSCIGSSTFSHYQLTQTINPVFWR